MTARARALALALCGASASAACGGAPALEAAQPISTASAPTAAVHDPAPTIDGDVTAGQAGGVTVVVKTVPGAAFVAGQIWVRGGARNWTAADAGIEKLALSVAASGGAGSLDKTALARKLAGLGATITADAGSDGSALRLKAPAGAWDAAFPLLVDVLRRPALAVAEVELERSAMLAALQHEDEDPDDRTWSLLRAALVAGHPYANRAGGTLASVRTLRADRLAPYLEALRVKSRLLVVVAGDVEPARVFDQVGRALGDLPAGDYVDTPLPPLSFDAPHLVTERRAIPTNYCEIAFPAPAWSDPDYAVGLVAMTVLSRRFYDEVRVKRNLAYVMGAEQVDWAARGISLISVASVDPNAAMTVMLDQMRRLGAEPMSAADLDGFKATFLTEYLQAHETVAGQATDLANAAIHGKDWRLARGIPSRVRAIVAADLQAYARRYFVHGQSAVLGDPAKVDPAVFTAL